MRINTCIFISCIFLQSLTVAAPYNKNKKKNLEDIVSVLLKKALLPSKTPNDIIKKIEEIIKPKNIMLLKEHVKPRAYEDRFLKLINSINARDAGDDTNKEERLNKVKLATSIFIGKMDTDLIISNLLKSSEINTKVDFDQSTEAPKIHELLVAYHKVNEST